MNQHKIREEISSIMVEIPSGEITMRDDRLKEAWPVEINPFLLSKHVVTQVFYREITNKNPSEFEGEKRPVEGVSWKDAIEFCNLLSERLGLEKCYIVTAEKEETSFDEKANGFRLPTEAEWEFACKAGTKGGRYGEIDTIAWYRNNAGGQTQEVGLKEPNSFGLYDMLGNVWEWCSDIYDETVYGSYRIIRGGGWNDEERGCLATNRRRSHPIAFKIDDLGFRIARNIF
ncbi:formylglycine-generating enzyme family protein [Flammeovirgaceae bacterium SG7u.111]|nr:formylglycine-generating enzyme family protein [Flammeovirgaceae bacterium SG7u.132]WPO38600.1 formylglycine-generating enzyme family protein [Flammeovirgaceae bacterium SG7u.111]